MRGGEYRGETNISPGEGFSMQPDCAHCRISRGQMACRVPDGVGPASCPTTNQGAVGELARQRYQVPEIQEFARQASIQEAAGYANKTPGVPSSPKPRKTRIEEVCDFAARMGHRRLGLAFCAGLRAEAEVLSDIISSRGFEVLSIICKAGCVPKEHIGINDEHKIGAGGFEVMCNPILQAEALNDAGTEFNLMLGLCVGHDSLFFSHSRAPVTVVAVKDRVLGHNPLAALYTSGSYYSTLKK